MKLAFAHHRIGGIEELLSNMSLMISGQDQTVRKTARGEIIRGLKIMTPLEKAEAINRLLGKLSESSDTCQQHYIVSILTNQLDPDIDKRIIEAIESGNGNIEPYTKTYVYGILKKFAPDNVFSMSVT